MPGAEQVRFVGTGSEATFYALRLARSFTKRSKVMTLAGAFHGTNDYAVPGSNGVPPALRKEIIQAPFNDLESTGKLIAEHAGELAAVIAECPQRCIVPRPDFIRGLREITRQHEVLLIVDEVISGFRLAYGGAQERYGVQADLACYGKIVGGGYPLAAVVGRSEIMQLCDVRRQQAPGFTLVGGTLSGNPLTAAAGLATLAELRKPGTYERLHTLGRRLRDGLEEIGRRRGVPLRAAGEDTVFMPLITEVEPTDARSLAKSDGQRTYRFGIEMVKRGVLLTRTVFLATSHTEADIDRALEVADEVIAAM
jgi:glutamate-1-semialdehyde 2,1-aminomutase